MTLLKRPATSKVYSIYTLHRYWGIWQYYANSVYKQQTCITCHDWMIVCSTRKKLWWTRRYCWTWCGLYIYKDWLIMKMSTPVLESILLPKLWHMNMPAMNIIHVIVSYPQSVSYKLHKNSAHRELRLFESASDPYLQTAYKHTQPSGPNIYRIQDSYESHRQPQDINLLQNGYDMYAYQYTYHSDLSVRLLKCHLSRVRWSP